MRWFWSVALSLAVAGALGAGAFAVVRLSQRAARRLDAVPPLRAARAGGAAGLSWVTARLTARLLALVAGTAVALTLAVLFAQLLAAVVAGDDLAAVDRPAVEWVFAHRPAWLTPFVVSVTDLGGKALLTVAVATAALLAARRTRSPRPLLLAACALGGCALLVAAVKVTIGRDRPDPLLHALTESGFAFPSGHSASALAGWALVAWLVRDLTASRTLRATAWVAAGLLTAAVGLSRIYLGVHYPSDVIGGWALAGLWLATLFVAWRPATARRPGDAPLTRRAATALSAAAAAALAATAGVAGTLAVTGLPGGAPTITSGEARRIALSHAGDGTPTEVELEWEHGTLVWSVDLWRHATEYDVDVDARTGTVLAYGPDR